MTFNECVAHRRAAHSLASVVAKRAHLVAFVIASERPHVCLLVIHEGIVGSESSLVAMNVGVTTSSIDSVVHALSWAALAATSRDMRWANFMHFSAKSASSLGRGGCVRNRKTPAVAAHVAISTCSISSIDLGSASAC